MTFSTLIKLIGEARDDDFNVIMQKVVRTCHAMTWDEFGEGLCGVFADGLSAYLTSIGIPNEIRSGQDHAVVVVGKYLLHAASWNVGDISDYPTVGHPFVKSRGWSDAVKRAFEADVFDPEEFKKDWAKQDGKLET